VSEIAVPWFGSERGVHIVRAVVGQKAENMKTGPFWALKEADGKPLT
jgi:hypothetical protein